MKQKLNWYGEVNYLFINLSKGPKDVSQHERWRFVFELRKNHLDVKLCRKAEYFHIWPELLFESLSIST